MSVNRTLAASEQIGAGIVFGEFWRRNLAEVVGKQGRFTPKISLFGPKQCWLWIKLGISLRYNLRSELLGAQDQAGCQNSVDFELYVPKSWRNV